MPDIHTALPKLSFTYSDWMRETSRFMLPRSGQLIALDQQLDTYIRLPTGDHLIFLKNAFRQWRDAHGEGDTWKHSKRNDKYYPFTRLYAELYKDGDTDAAFGVPSFMAPDLVQARLGLLYLFGKLDCDPGVFSLVTNGVLDMLGSGLDYGSEVGGDSAQKAIGDTQKVLSSGGRAALEKAAEKLDKHAAVRRVPAPPGSTRIETPPEQARTVQSRDLLGRQAPALNGDQRRLSEIIFDYFRKAWDYVVGVWDEHGGAALRSLCDYLTGKFLSDAAGEIMGGSFGVASNLYKLIEASFERYKSWAGARVSVVLAGTPTAIVDGIERAMNLGIARNLYNTLKSGAQLGMQIASVGASTLVNLITSIVEILVKTAWRLVETIRLKRFFADARDKWNQRAALQLHTRPIDFNKWFGEYAIGVPAVSALAMNSGLCSKMHFLQMFAADQQVITQSQYDAGVARLGHLRGWSANYLRDAGYSMSSGDALVSALIKPAENGPENAVRKHLLKPLSAFLDGGVEHPSLGALSALGIG